MFLGELPSEALIDRYIIKERIRTRSGQGHVYVAEDKQNKQQVAIKVIALDHNSDQDEATLRLFHREMEAPGKLDGHPHILPLYNYGSHTFEGSTLLFLVMPYCKDGSLGLWLEKRRKQNAGPLSPQDVSYFVHQATDALIEAHDQGIVHLDVKPDNFLIRQNRRNGLLPNLVLADFGITKFLNDTNTVSDTVRGTGAYMAPEQWQGHPCAASDQYALAIMAYELLTGTRPFAGDQPQLMHQHLHVDPKPPSTHNPQLSSALDRVIIKALAKKPDDRYPSVIDFAEAFEEATRFGEPGADVHLTLAISNAEALSGTNCQVTLPNGRQVTVTVPANARDGQQLRMDGEGEPSMQGGPAGTLIVTITTTSDNTIMKRLESLSQEFVALKKGHTTILQRIGKLSHAIEDATGTQDDILSLVRSSYAQAIAEAASSSSNPYPPYNGRLVLEDPLIENNQKTMLSVDEYRSFKTGGFEITASKAHQVMSSYFGVPSSYANFVFQVFLTIRGGTWGGITFRVNRDAGYYFGISAYGAYQLLSFQEGKTKILKEGSTNAINTDDCENLIAVLVRDQAIELYVNLQFVDAVIDNTSNQGLISLSAGGGPEELTTVLFSNARIWTW